MKKKKKKNFKSRIYGTPKREDTAKKYYLKVISGMLFAAACFVSIFVLVEFHTEYILVGIMCALLMASAYFFLGTFFDNTDEQLEELLKAQEALEKAKDDTRQQAEETFKKNIQAQVDELNKTSRALFMAVKKSSEASEQNMVTLHRKLDKSMTEQNAGIRAVIKFNKENARQVALSEKETLEELYSRMPAVAAPAIFEEDDDGNFVEIGKQEFEDTPVVFEEDPAIESFEPENEVSETELPEFDLSGIDFSNVEETEETLESEAEDSVGFEETPIGFDEAAVPDEEISIEIPESLSEESLVEESSIEEVLTPDEVPEEAPEEYPTEEIVLDEQVPEEYPTEEIVFDEQVPEEYPTEEIEFNDEEFEGEDRRPGTGFEEELDPLHEILAGIDGEGLEPVEEVAEKAAKEIEAEVDKSEDALAAATGVDLSNPNANLSADDIAKLFAAAGN